MNTKRKAELQRKLSMSSVPRPPADLADRIKREIPPAFGVDEAKSRPWWSAAGLRIAASLLVVVAAAYVAIELMPRRAYEPRVINAPAAAPKSNAKTVAAPNPQQPAPVATQASTASPAPAPEQRTTVAVHKEISIPPQPERAAAADTVSSTAEGVAPPPDQAIAAAPAVAATAADTRFAPSPAAPPASAPAEQITIRAIAPPTAPRAPVNDRVTQPARAITAGNIAAKPQAPVDTRAAAESRLVAETAAKMESADRSRVIAQTLFGISVDPAAFQRVKASVEDGERPPIVNVPAIINYFGTTPEEPVSRVSLQLEGSPAPVLRTPFSRIVRLSIDTPHDLSGAVAATDARLEVGFDPHAVGSVRVSGGGSVVLSQHLLRNNSSVTALYEVELKPALRRWQTVVTVRLTYRDASTRRVESIRKDLRVKDLAPQWLDASRRHRLVSLGAIWAESLKSENGQTDVAQRAEELAKEEPHDLKAGELAALASASSRLRSSGPTGSGR